MSATLRQRYWILAAVVGAVLLLSMSALLWRERQSAIQSATAVNQRVQQIAEAGVRTRLETTASMLADTLINPVYFFDLQVIEQSLVGVLRQPDIAYAVVLDRNGRILHDGSRDIARYAERPDDAFAAAAIATAVPLTQVSARWMEAAQPLLLGEERIGVLRLGLDLQLANTATDAVPVPFAWDPDWWWWLGIVGMLLAVTALWVERRWVLPLAHWQSQSRSLLARRPLSGVKSLAVVSAGQLVGKALGFAVDELALADSELRRQLLRDALTGLPNRLALRQRLAAELQTCREHEWELALLFLDLDDFKRINDTLGHDIGDDVLAEVAHRFAEVLSVEGPAAGSFVARFGGDEFVVLIRCPAARQRAATLAEALLNALDRPFRKAEQNLHLTTSIGITSFPDDASDAVQLLKNGDIAMYLAKVHGRQCYRFFTPYLTQLANDRLALEQDLREAMNNGALQVYYQPIVHLKTGRIHGAEALVRWQHHSRGMVPPSLFVGIAEDVGLIDALGAFVLREATREAVGWTTFDHRPTFVAVNLSVKQLRDPRLPQQVTSVLRECALPPQRLHLEITESALLDDESLAYSSLTELNRLGIDIWLDDFGTGFSGLSHLRRVNVSGVKIDRTFVADLLSDRHDLALTNAIVAMAESLQITAVAEGVETAAQLEMLSKLNCEYGQGFWLGRPMTATDFRARLAHESADLAAAGRRLSDAG